MSITNSSLLDPLLIQSIDSDTNFLNIGLQTQIITIGGPDSIVNIQGGSDNIPVVLNGAVTGPSSNNTIANGVIVDNMISSTATISDSKLNTISTAGKVANSATTATTSNNDATIVLRDITNGIDLPAINLFGNATTVFGAMFIGDINSSNMSNFNTLTANTSTITTSNANTSTITTLNANTSTIMTLNATTLNAITLTTPTLNANTSTITDLVTSTLSSTTAITTPSITINGGQALTTYELQIDTCSLTGPWSSSPTTTITFSRIGFLCTISIKAIGTFAVTSTTPISCSVTVPDDFTPTLQGSSPFWMPCMLTLQGQPTLGNFIINAGAISITLVQPVSLQSSSSLGSYAGTNLTSSGGFVTGTMLGFTSSINVSYIGNDIFGQVQTKNNISPNNSDDDDMYFEKIM